MSTRLLYNDVIQFCFVNRDLNRCFLKNFNTGTSSFAQIRYTCTPRTELQTIREHRVSCIFLVVSSERTSISSLTLACNPHFHFSPPSQPPYPKYIQGPEKIDVVQGTMPTKTCVRTALRIAAMCAVVAVAEWYVAACALLLGRYAFVFCFPSIHFWAWYFFSSFLFLSSPFFLFSSYLVQRTVNQWHVLLCAPHAPPPLRTRAI